MSDLVGGGPGPESETEPQAEEPAAPDVAPHPPAEGEQPTAEHYGEPGETQPDWMPAPASEVAPGRPQGDPAPPDTARTPDTTVDGQPAAQTGTESGPAAGPSPDAGGTTLEPE